MIELKNITKIYHNYNGSKVTALKDVSFKLASTGLTFIAGQSGGGKSTLLNILSGVDVQTSGELLVNGISTDKLGSKGFDGYRNNFVGIIHQGLNMLDYLTLGQNVSLAMELKGVKPDASDISELFKKLGIEGLENRYPNQCSLGQCQRAAIARTLIKKPKVIIADEPTSGVDAETRMDIYSLLKEISKDILVIASSHSREMVDRFADRILMIESGRIFADIITAEDDTNIAIFNKGKVIAVEPETVLKATDVDKINSIIRANNKRGIFMCLETNPARVQEFNPSASKEIVQATLREKKQKKEACKKEKRQVLEETVDSGVFQFEKSTLPMKSAWRFSLVNFNSNKLRSIFTVTLSIIAIMFFALTSNIARLDINNLTINSFSEGNDPYITFSTTSRLFNKSKWAGDEKDKWIEGRSASTEYDKSGLVYDFGKSAVTSAPAYIGGANLDANIMGVRKLVVDDASGYDKFNSLGLELIVGHWPNSSQSNGISLSKQIVISDFVATQIQTAAFMRATFNTQSLEGNVPTFSQMVDEEGNNLINGDANSILIDGNEYKIVGIYKTDFSNYFLFDDVETDIDARFLKCVPSNKEFFQPSMLRINPNLSKNEKSRAEYLIQNDYVTAFVSAEFIKNITNGDKFTINKTIAESDYYITGHSAGADRGDLYSSILNTSKNYSEGIKLMSTRNLVSGYDDITSGVIKVSQEFYNKLLTDKQRTENRIEFNIAKRVQSYSILPDWTDDDSGSNTFDLNNVTHSYHVLRSFSFEIDSSSFINIGGDYSMLLCDTDYAQLMLALVVPSTSFVMADSYNVDILKTVLGRMGEDVSVNFADSASIVAYTGGFDSSTGVVTTASIAFAVFVAALMYSYIFQSIRSKRKSIAVIRSMGARTFDVFKIFILEALVIAGLICFGALGITLIASAIGNSVIHANSGLVLSIFNFDVLFNLLIISVAFLIILISYMLPVFAYARHSRKGLARKINVKGEN